MSDRGDKRGREEEIQSKKKMLNEITVCIIKI